MPQIASRSSSRNSSNSREAARSFRNFANNKPLPTVPNERPPFITPPSATPEPTLEADAQQIQPVKNSVPGAAAQIRSVPDSDSERSIKQTELVEPVYKETLSSGAVVSAEIIGKPSGDGRDSAKSQEHPSGARDDGVILLKQDVYRPEQPVQFSEEKEVIVAKPVDSRAKDEHSPPLTGKDSAYSSISGGSFASPMAAHPRSASAQGSYPRAQFGLFPSSTPSTPKHSVSGRYGPASPALVSPKHPEQPAYLPPRSQTSLDNHLPSSRKLLKKSSLSSLKRLFSKKRHGAVEPIAE